MPNMFRNFSYPGSDFHEMNLQWLFDCCCRTTGIALNVSGNALRLVNSEGEVLSSVIVSYAEKALADKNGKDISTYIFSVAGVGDTLAFTKGDGTITTITVPYAEKSKYDIDGHEIEDYIYNVQVAGDKLRITHGDGTIAEITVPYAVKATNDEDGKDITTYAASLSVEGDNVCLRDAKGRLLNSITVAYATKALQDVDGDAIKTTYAVALQTGTTTVSLKAKDGTVLSTITVPFATEASHADEADHATVATDATNAVESVAVSGDQIVFTTYGGQTFNITSPYSVKAQKDDNGNIIKTTYIANVTNDAGTGKLQFRDALGNVVVELLPTLDAAVHDSYNNLIADYVKTIVVSQNSDYVTVTHGTGTTDTLTIHYSETAWKDTNGNVIKNTYVKDMECVEDVDDGHWKLVAYNGDNPQAELFRFEVYAYAAQTDVNGKDLTSYVADVDYNANKEIEVTDGEGNVLKTLANKLENVADVDIDGSTLADGDVLTYDANDDEWKNKPASGGGGDVIQVPNATNVALATCFHGTGYDLMALDIDLNLTCNPYNFQYPSISWGLSLVTDANNETWQEFIIQDSNCLSYLPGAIVVGGKTFPISSAGNLFGYLTYSFLNPGTNNNASEPNRHQNITIESVEVRNYDLNYNLDIPRVYIRGFVKTNTLYSDGVDLIKHFVSTNLWSPQDLTYFHVQGKAYSTLV